MAKKGLYYYKLVSPYLEDVTKDCKLSINEIDSNFKTLKDADIKDVKVDEDTQELVIYRNDGEAIRLSLSEFKPKFNVEYDDIDGVINISYDNDKYAITGLITKENLSEEIMTKVYSDGTLDGIGTSTRPLGIANVHRTGFYKPVIKVVDLSLDGVLPSKHLSKGDRFLVIDRGSDYGYLYNYDGVKHINKLLEKTGWRVPSKSDWDNMLNAVEPCEYRNHNSTLNNRVLGMMAGTLLKSEEDWNTPCHPEHFSMQGEMMDCMNYDSQSDIEETIEFDVDGIDAKCCKPHPSHKPCHKPHPKPIPSHGKNSYGMGILPAGCGYFTRPIQYAHFGTQGAFWTTDVLYSNDIYTKVFTSHDSGVLQVADRPSTLLSIRLVKDYDGTNFSNTENILGKNYRTVLMPSLNTPNKYTIWTAQNLSFKEHCILSMEPNKGFGIVKKNAFFIYEWNGVKWDILEISEGDSVVVIEGKRKDEVYRIVDNKLINADDSTIKYIKNDVMLEVEDVKARIVALEELTTDHDDRIEAIKLNLDGISNTLNNIDSDIDALRKVDSELHEQDVLLENMIDNLSKRVTSFESEANDNLDEITKKIEDLREELESAINDKEQEIYSKIEELESKHDEDASRFNEALDNEAKERTDADTAIMEMIEAEAAERKDADSDLAEKIEDEKTKREEADEELRSLINSDSTLIDEINERLDNEIAERKEEDVKLDERIVVLEGKALVKDKCVYDVTTGILTLKTENEDETITVQFSNDFGSVVLSQPEE